MDMSSIKWDSEQGMEDCNYMNTLHMGYPEFEALDEFKPPPQNYQNSLSSQKSYERPTKKIKTNTSWTNHHISPKNSSSSSSHIISFGDSCYGPTDHQPFCGNLDSFVEPKNEVLFNEDHRTKSPTSLRSYGLYDENKYKPQGGQGVKRGIGGMTRSPSHALDHVLAERKRRERLAERIIALSAIIPGLKKIDKASVLGDAIKYLKHLQERVKQLEEQAKKKSEESVVCINKSTLSADEDSSSCEENSSGCFKESRCEIEARISEKNVLIRVHCEKKKGFVVKMIREIENLHLNVVNSSVLPFGNHAMDIAVVAQMDAEFGMTVEDLVRNLRSALL